MNVVAIHGLKGGVGVTTIVANLAAALRNQDAPVLAIDFCPQNSLRLHFGMPLSDTSGFAVQIAQKTLWHNAAYEAHNGIRFLPFGQDSEYYSHSVMNHYVEDHPDFLRNWLDSIDLPEHTWVLIDCPVKPSVFNDAARKVADLSLLVINPEVLVYTTLHIPHYLSQMNIAPGNNNLLLLNRYNPAFDLDKDITSLLKADFEKSMVPITIHRDQCLCEAFACKKTVNEFAPSAQSAQDFALIAFWLNARQAERDKRKLALVE